MQEQALINTAVDFAVFNVLREVSLPLYPAVAVALVVATAVSYVKAIGKIPLVVCDGPGFVPRSACALV